MILYEFPINERVRTLLRLEDIFARLAFFVAQDDARAHHAALQTLFDLLEVASRADLKSDLLQELEKQRQTLQGYRNNPVISEAALDAVLTDMEAAAAALSRSAGKTGQYLRENEWLMSIKSRMVIPGGACEFDLPSYHSWLHRDPAQRVADIRSWVAPMFPLRDSLEIVLKLLRESGHRTRAMAQSGLYQQMLAGRTVQMIQVRLDPATGFIPEVSANKHMLSVRFSHQGGDLRPRPSDAEVDFELTLCSLVS